MTAISILFIGFLLGMKHATEADHLAAVATLATRQSSFAQAMVQGAAWGVGHTATLMLFGGVVLALGKSIPEHLAQSLEFGVGIMLIVLGADVLRRLARQGIHFHVHSHDTGETHVHAHSHAEVGPHESSAHRHEHARHAPLRALAVGMMHGMAGSAALILLSLGSVTSVGAGIAYIALFGAGSIVGMALLSVAIAIPLRLSATRLTWMHGGMTFCIGLFSCVLGTYVVYDIGIVEGLLLVSGR